MFSLSWGCAKRAVLFFCFSWFVREVQVVCGCAGVFVRLGVVVVGECGSECLRMSVCVCVMLHECVCVLGASHNPFSMLLARYPHLRILRVSANERLNAAAHGF